MNNESCGINDLSNLTKEYVIIGMDCSNCAKTVEKNVANIAGVKDVQVSFASGKMRVQVEHRQILDNIPLLIRKLGYDLEAEKINSELIDTYIVKGMDCGNCAKSIEKHFAQLTDVNNVVVNFATGTMTIDYQFSSSLDIQKELQKIGYTGSLKATNEEVRDGNKKSFQSVNKNLLFSAILLLIGASFTYIGHFTSLGAIFFFASMVTSGVKPAKSAFYALKSKTLDMNVLMVSAAIGASFIGQWMEGAMVVFLFSFGNYLQVQAVDKTRQSIKELMNLTPEIAFVVKENGYEEIPVTSIIPGHLVLAKAGGKIPVDGVVIEGISTVDQAPITGESIPVTKKAGSEVFAGTINQEGSLTIRATRKSQESTIAKILTLVEKAQEAKAPAEAFVDRFAKVYTPFVFILAILVMIVPTLFLKADFSVWFYKGLELLVVACPCALVISTPVAIVSAIGNAAKNGVLIKGGTFLEKVGQLSAIAFDKTGTITEGKLVVTNTVSLTQQLDQTMILQLLASLETHTTHPIGKAIAHKALEEKITLLDIKEFKTVPGKGIEAMINGTLYHAGSVDYFNSKLISEQSVEQITTIIMKKKFGNTIVLLGTKEKILGFVTLTDLIRPSTKETMLQLKRTGIKETIMLTGDNLGAAKKIAEEAEITNFYANLLPEEKVSVINELKHSGNVVAMVGDGINDAPALACADLGIAMGGAGSDMAIETADIVLMADNIEKLPFVIQLGQQSNLVIKQNIAFSLIIKIIAIGFIFPGWLSLWIAVLSDSGAAILVTLNALRLMKKDTYK